MSIIKPQKVKLGKGVDVRGAKLNNVTVGDRTRIRDYTIIFGSNDKPVKIGFDCYIGPYCYLQGFFGLEIGDNVSLAPGVMVFSDSGPNSGELLKVYPIKRGKVTIGSNIWIGAGVKIFPGVSIGDNSVIAANSVVDGDIPEGVLAGGVPAKIMKKLKL